MNLLHSTDGLQGFSIIAKDGELGSVKDVYFDDQEWTVRYLVVDTGGWLTGRKVLLSPHAVTGADWRNHSLAVNLTREQVQNSPSIETAKPVVRQHEVEFYDYYGYPYYWSGPYLWGYTVLPGMLEQKPLEDEGRQEDRVRMEQKRARNDPHLRSADEVIGYDIQATDDTIGHVEDLLFDEESWKIALMVVDTRNWWPGKKVMVPPGRIERVSWEGKSVVVNVTREQIEDSPEYDPEANLPPDTGSARLFRQFGPS
ncbi:PRC-barrel domain-containing protein [Noviherbaspirillum sp. ST9]|uniref:PRC-barrel domain-containing protein n=1 Tax=Noviherbaspirillum sp. ST9 TaxID=3401606 RepID=UPI003B58723E